MTEKEEKEMKEKIVKKIYKIFDSCFLKEKGTGIRGIDYLAYLSSEDYFCFSPEEIIKYRREIFDIAYGAFQRGLQTSSALFEEQQREVAVDQLFLLFTAAVRSIE
jgi:hypothetical protein